MVKHSGSSSNDSFNSAHSSITVVPSDGSIGSSKTGKGDSDAPFDSTKRVTDKIHVKKHGAKSNTIKSVGKGNKTFGLKKGKSVGNVPTDISKFMIAAEQKKSMPIRKVDNLVAKSPSNCNALPKGDSIESNKKFQSDHNPVVVYLPGLFDGTKSAYVITYNEKGNSGIFTENKQGFLSQLPLIKTVDMVFIGIQEGDVNKVFVNDLISNINIVFDDAFARLYNPPENMEKAIPYFASPNNMVLANIKGSRHVLPSNYWKLTTITYESTGKECLKKWKGACLVNGCYVLIRSECGLIVEDSGKDIIMKGGVLKTTKHCAWAVIKQESSNIKHVFASCHLEYSGKYNPKKKDLLGYDKRKEQLTGYISMLYKKYNSVSRFIFCGDTNMRMLSSANYNHEIKTKYILDQMLYYLMQCDNKNTLKSIVAINNYLTINNVDAFESDSEGKHVLNSKFWNCGKCDITLGRKMLLYRIGNDNPFCSYLTGNVKNNKTPEYKDITEQLLGSDILNKFNEVDTYVLHNKSKDKFAGYCMNPSFVAGDNMFRAYDFSYKDLTSICMMNTIWDVYNYKPTAIFTLDGPNRTFDYDKRVKSGYILAPAVVDRVFMFEPHNLHVTIDNVKVGFVKY